MHSSWFFLDLEVVFTILGVIAFCYFLTKPLNTPVWNWYQYLSIAITVWTVGQLLTTLMLTYSRHIFLHRLLVTIQYIGVITIAPIWLMCCLYYCGEERLAENKKLRMGLVLFASFFFFSILTDDLHHLMFTRFEFDVQIYGPLMYVFTFISYVIMGAASFKIILFEYRRQGRIHWEIITLVLALLSLPLASALTLFFPNIPMKLVPVAFVIDWVVFYLLALKYRYFNILPLALSTVFSTISYPMLVVKKDFSLIYVNRVVRERFNISENEVQDLKIGDIYPNSAHTLEGAIKAIADKERETDEGVFTIFNHKKRYLRYTMREMNPNEIMVIILDVTEYHEQLESLRNYNEELELLNQELESDTSRLQDYINDVADLISERERQKIMQGIHDEMYEMLHKVEENFILARDSNEKKYYEENLELTYNNLQEVRRIVRELTNVK